MLLFPKIMQEKFWDAVEEKQKVALVRPTAN
jgi:hypothetical protein